MVGEEVVLVMDGMEHRKDGGMECRENLGWECVEELNTETINKQWFIKSTHFLKHKEGGRDK